MPDHMIMQYADFAVGDRSTFTKTVTEADVYLFAGLSGDQNPLHVDAEFARGTRFGGRIAHGILASGYVSAALTGLGIGHVYLSQSVQFLRPVRIGDTITAVAEIVEKLPEKRRLRVSTYCVNQRQERVNAGEAVLQCLPELFGAGQ